VLIKRIRLLLTVAIVMAAMGLVMAVPAFAQESEDEASPGELVICSGVNELSGHSPFLCQSEEEVSGPLDFNVVAPDVGQHSHRG
jgi:hypothetical protein